MTAPYSERLLGGNQAIQQEMAAALAGTIEQLAAAQGGDALRLYTDPRSPRQFIDFGPGLDLNNPTGGPDSTTPHKPVPLYPRRVPGVPRGSAFDVSPTGFMLEDYYDPGLPSITHNLRPAAASTVRALTEALKRGATERPMGRVARASARVGLASLFDRHSGDKAA